MRRSVLVSLVLAAALGAGVRRARADDIVAYEVEGDAPAAASDPRTTALDDGFAHAVLAALAELVPADARNARKADLDREIVAHARLWVARFTVTRDETNDDRRQLALAVRIDRDKLRARLTELGIATQVAGVAPPAQPTASSAHVALPLVSIASPAGTRASFGDGAVVDLPGIAALSAALSAAGYAVARAPTHGAGADAGDLPLADAAAGAVAVAANADQVTVAGVRVGPAVPVRGLPETAAVVTAHVRVLDPRALRLVGQGVASCAARGDGDVVVAKAVDRVIGEALSDALPAPPTPVVRAPKYTGEDVPVAEPGVVLIRLPSRTPWTLVVAEQKYLTNARGVQSVSLRRLSPGGWTLGVVTSESAERVAEIARKPPAIDTTATVRIAGGIVEVSLVGASP